MLQSLNNIIQPAKEEIHTNGLHTEIMNFLEKEGDKISKYVAQSLTGILEKHRQNYLANMSEEDFLKKFGKVKIPGSGFKKSGVHIAKHILSGAIRYEMDLDMFGGSTIEQVISLVGEISENAYECKIICVPKFGYGQYNGEYTFDIIKGQNPIPEDWIPQLRRIYAELFRDTRRDNMVQDCGLISFSVETTSASPEAVEYVKRVLGKAGYTYQGIETVEYPASKLWQFPVRTFHIFKEPV